MSDEAGELIAYCRERGRVCPMPPHWNLLWESLPHRRRVGHGWEPPAPLILAAWHESTDDQKQERLAVHVRWAAAHGGMPQVAAFLQNLAENQWHHAGD